MHERAMNANSQKYKDLVETKLQFLQPALLRILRRREQIQHSLEQYELLQERIEEVASYPDEEHHQPIHGLVDIGSGAKAKVEIDDPNEVVVDLGLGVLPVLTLEEARQKIVPKKIQQLRQEAQRLDEAAGKVRADITIANQAIRQLYGHG